MQSFLPRRRFNGIVSPAASARSYENFYLSHGKKLRAGEVAKLERAVSLATGAHTHTSTVLDTLTSAAGLIVGDVYDVTGTDIVAGTTFTYGGGSAGVLSVAATGSHAIADLVVTRPAGVGSWNTAGDTPAGISLYDADGTDAAAIADANRSQTARTVRAVKSS
jgi:hypothetical protein